MTTMISEIYDALTAAGTPDDKARKVAEAVAAFETKFVDFGTERDRIGDRFDQVDHQLESVEAKFAKVDRDVAVLKWMLGFVLAFQAGIFVKLFFH